jgi:hypothetical protein
MRGWILDESKHSMGSFRSAFFGTSPNSRAPEKRWSGCLAVALCRVLLISRLTAAGPIRTILGYPTKKIEQAGQLGNFKYLLARTQARKDAAVRSAENVLDDPDKASDIESEDFDDWVERKKITTH